MLSVDDVYVTGRVLDMAPPNRRLRSLTIVNLSKSSYFMLSLLIECIFLSRESFT